MLTEQMRADIRTCAECVVDWWNDGPMFDAARRVLAGLEAEPIIQYTPPVLPKYDGVTVAALPIDEDEEMCWDDSVGWAR